MKNILTMLFCMSLGFALMARHDVPQPDSPPGIDSYELSEGDFLVMAEVAVKADALFVYAPDAALEVAVDGAEAAIVRRSYHRQAQSSRLSQTALIVEDSPGSLPGSEVIMETDSYQCRKVPAVAPPLVQASRPDGVLDRYLCRQVPASAPRSTSASISLKGNDPAPPLTRTNHTGYSWRKLNFRKHGSSVALGPNLSPGMLNRHATRSWSDKSEESPYRWI